MADQNSFHTGDVDIHYQKSAFFRVIHADGAFGAPNPRGILNFAIFSERTALPKLSKIHITDGIPGPEQIVETKSGIVREIEANVSMDVGVATLFHQWLGQQIELVKSQMSAAQQAMMNQSGAEKK